MHARGLGEGLADGLACGAFEFLADKNVCRLGDGTAERVAPPPPEVLAGALPMAAAPFPSEPDREGSAAEEALRALEAAEERLREGDWIGFGSGLDSVRAILREEVDPESP